MAMDCNRQRKNTLEKDGRLDDIAVLLAVVIDRYMHFRLFLWHIVTKEPFQGLRRPTQPVIV